MIRDTFRRSGPVHIAEFIQEALEPLLLRRCKDCDAVLGRGPICTKCGARNHPRYNEKAAAA